MQNRFGITNRSGFIRHEKGGNDVQLLLDYYGQTGVSIRLEFESVYDQQI